MLAAVSGLSADRITAAAPGERTLSFYHIHTKETLTVTYKKNGEYVSDAMKKIDWIMRDWRKNQSVRMDPETIDLIWEMHSELGSQQPISIICGYRSRGTNEMLRRKVGGQASQSQHITGKAIDITFPDVPLKRMRYSALVRERGGVGYYPTSGIPFIHVDTSRVRAWPRLPRYELALLFPSGRTKHAPASGGSISPDDVRAARAKHQDLAQQIAQFHDDRRNPKSTQFAVANAGGAGQPEKRGLTLASLTDALPWSAKKTAEKPILDANGKPRVRWEPIPGSEVKREQPKPAAGTQVAALSPDAALPKLVNQPKLLDRPSRFEPRTAAAKPAATAPATTAAKAPAKDKDRATLAALVAKAQSEPMPKLVSEPKPAVRPAQALAAAEMPEGAGRPPQKGARVAALIPEREESNSITDMSPESLGNGWVQAPEFDEDHPEELAYRPFPLAPLLTESASGAEPQFGDLQHPDVAQTLELIDDVGAVLPMRFRPGQQVARVLWAQQFQGKAVYLDALEELDQSRAATGIAERAVKTSKR